MTKRFSLFQVMATATGLLKDHPKLSRKKTVKQAYVLYVLTGKKKGMTNEKIGEAVIDQMTSDIKKLTSIMAELME
jgi:hypothetical protein